MTLHPAEISPDELMKDCDVRRERRSGPGGQHRNKVETAVVLVHRPSGIKGEASERRSQHENRRVAVARLRVNLALALRLIRPVESVPSERWQARCRGGSFRVNPQHEDFAPLLAEALDVIDAQRQDVPAAARALRVTTSQLIRFLQAEPRACEQVNRQRVAAGLHRLK